MPRFDVRGLVIETRTPTLAQLSAVKAAARGVQDYDAARALVKACAVSPPFVELLRKRPSSIQGLALQIAMAAGVGGTVRLLEEPEITDEAMAAAYVEHAGRLAALYRDEDDERRTVLPVELETDGGASARRFLLRRPLESEVERYRKANTAEAAKLLVTRIALWGDADGLEASLPGAYLTLAEFALDVCGDYEARLLGES